VALKIYKPTRIHASPDVRNAELPWVYDQDPSSGNVASITIKKKPTEQQIKNTKELLGWEWKDEI